MAWIWNAGLRIKVGILLLLSMIPFILIQTITCRGRKLKTEKLLACFQNSRPMAIYVTTIKDRIVHKNFPFEPENLAFFAAIFCRKWAVGVL
jgi:hypothetical protein